MAYFNRVIKNCFCILYTPMTKERVRIQQPLNFAGVSEQNKTFSCCLLWEHYGSRFELDGAAKVFIFWDFLVFFRAKGLSRWFKAHVVYVLVCWRWIMSSSLQFSFCKCICYIKSLLPIARTAYLLVP